jgi:hypothetical protein
LFVEQPRQQTQRLFEFAGANPLLKAAMTCLERFLAIIHAAIVESITEMQPS